MRGRWQPGLFGRYAALITALVAGLVVVTSLVHGQLARLSSAESDNTYVVASDGSLVAHLDLAAVLGKVNVAALPQVAGGRRGSTQFLGKSLSGEEVYSKVDPGFKTKI